MPRYIDADELDIFLLDCLNRIDKHEERELYKYIDWLKTRFSMIPIVDVALVVHGKWISETHYGDIIGYTCSVCGTTQCIIDGTPEDNEWEFCPHKDCGAKMDLE